LERTRARRYWAYMGSLGDSALRRFVDQILFATEVEFESNRSRIAWPHLPPTRSIGSAGAP
jgi:hypothetical protein